MRLSRLSSSFFLALLCQSYPWFDDIGSSSQGLLVQALSSSEASASSSGIESLKQQARKVLGDAIVDTEAPYNNDVFYRRFLVDNSDNNDPQQLLDAHLKWRISPQGMKIAPAAHQAVLQATSSSSSSWKNDPVMQAAPSGAIIGQYLTSENCWTTTIPNGSAGDLCYCIRAGRINDDALMQAVPENDLTDFFVYAKHVQAIVANQRSNNSDSSLVKVVTCNDLSGVKLVGGSKGAAAFRQALGASSKITGDLYPNTAGPTLLLNLPPLLQILVNLFTPLFPPSVKARLQFARGVLKPEWELKDVAMSNGVHRQEFLQELNKLLNK